MHAQIRDAEVLCGIAPHDLSGYLRATGWRQAALREGISATWLRAVDEAEYEVLQPLDREVRGYAARLAEALATLAVLERRSQLAVYRDVVSATEDVVRVPLGGDTPGSDSITLVQGALAVENLRALVEAGACAAAGPRANYTRKPDQVVNYMAQVRLGQTEIGSFVLTVASPLPPLRQPPGQDTDADLPFARRAVEALASAVDALRVAASTALATNCAEPIERAVPRGVSANLCQAVAGLGQSNAGRGLDLRFSWARTWAPSRELPASVRLSADTLRVAADAATILRERAPREACEVTGPVVKLSREEGAGPGTVVIKTYLDGQWRSVQVLLSADSYQQAIDAHKSGCLVACVGDLAKDGRGYALRHPRDFAMVAEA